MGVSKDFEKAMANSKEAKARFKESKKVRPTDGGMGWQPPKGNYTCRVTADGVKDDKGKRVMLRNTIVAGEFVNKSWTKTFFLDPKDDSKAAQEQCNKNWESLSKAVQVCLGVDEAEYEKMELSQIINTIDEEGPYVKIGVTVNTVKDKKSKDPKATVTFTNTFYNTLLDPDDVEDETEGEEEEEEEEEVEEEDAKEEEGEEEEEEEGEEEEEVEEEEEEEEEEEVVFEKDDFVYYKPKGKKTPVECQVVTVSKTKKTASLKEYEGGTKHPNVPWDKLEHVTEE